MSNTETDEKIYEVYSPDGEMVACVVAPLITKAAEMVKAHWPCRLVGKHVPGVDMWVDERGNPTVNLQRRTVNAKFKDSLPG